MASLLNITLKLKRKLIFYNNKKMRKINAKMQEKEIKLINSVVKCCYKKKEIRFGRKISSW